MSRLTKKPIKIPEGVTINASDSRISVKGPKGEVGVITNPGISVKVENGEAMTDSGTTWALLRNAVDGVTEGFTKILEIEGVGYRAVVEGNNVMLYLGYAKPVQYPILEGVTVVVEKNVVKVSGINKELVGRVAAEIRAFKKPEPYKGKGIRYQGEVIRRKVGKKAATAAG